MARYQFRPPRLQRPTTTANPDEHDAAMDQLVELHRAHGRTTRPESNADARADRAEGSGTPG